MLASHPNCCHHGVGYRDAETRHPQLLASSTRMTLLSMNGPPHSSRSQPISPVGGGVAIHLAVGCEERWLARRAGPGWAPVGPVAVVLANFHNHLGRVIAFRDTQMAQVHLFGDLGLPQSRPCENVQSVVTTRPTAPACRARSTRSASASRPPRQ